VAGVGVFDGPQSKFSKADDEVDHQGIERDVVDDDSGTGVTTIANRI